MPTLTLPDRTWVPIAAPKVGEGPSAAGYGMKAGGVSIDTKREKIRVLGGDTNTGTLNSGTDTNAMFEATLRDNPLRADWRMVKPECPDLTKDTLYPGRPDRPFYTYDSRRDRDLEWIGYGNRSDLSYCPAWTSPLLTRIYGHCQFNPSTEQWTEGDWPPPPFEYFGGPIPAGGVTYDNAMGRYKRNATGQWGPNAYGGDANLEWGGVYDHTSDKTYHLVFDGGWGNSLWSLDLTQHRWSRRNLWGKSGELRFNTMHRSQLALVPGDAVWWYSRYKKGVIRYDIKTNTEQIIVPMDPRAYQPVDASTWGVMCDPCVYVPHLRTLVIVALYNFNGDFPGMFLVKIDPPYETEWIPQRSVTLDDFSGKTRIPWGNRVVYVPWADAIMLLGGHNPVPGTASGAPGTYRPIVDPDYLKGTRELTRWHWLWRLGGSAPPTIRYRVPGSLTLDIP